VKRALTGILAVSGVLVAVCEARAADPALERLAPVLVHDADERYRATSVAESGVPGTAGAARAPVVYGRVAAGGWLQFWIYFKANPHDRGILRSGRHAGDWELVQYRVDADGRPLEAVYAQHSGAERCRWPEVERRAGRPVVYLANGSHAAYFHAGTRDRMWPDPNDEADGRGVVQRPRVVGITAREPDWMRFSGPWGGARAGWFPPEQSSPPGPAFQGGGRWSDPQAWAERARDCTGRRCARAGACDGPETALAGGAAVVAALAALALLRRRSHFSKTRGAGPA
jgi:Vacuolar protein sorting-associated protein 62